MEFLVAPILVTVELTHIEMMNNTGPNTRIYFCYII